MAKKENNANDPQQEEKVDSKKSTPPAEGADKKITAPTTAETLSPASDIETNESETPNEAETSPEEKEPAEAEEKIDFSKLSLEELVEQIIKRTKAEKWFNDAKNIQELANEFDNQFKKEIADKKKTFIKEGGNEIDFYFKPRYKNEFDQALRAYKKQKRTYFQEREQVQKLNLERKLEIIEGIKELINVDENINTIYKRFKNLQESWHKTGPVPRPQSNNVWQTYKHHTEIFYDFLHLNRELRDLDFKHNYDEKVKIIEQAEALSEIPDPIKASRDLNTLHRLWKNDLGPVAKEHREELWERFQAASQVIHLRRQEFDKEYDKFLEENLYKKNALLRQMDEMLKNPPQSHSQWQKSIKDFNKIRADFQAIGQVPKKESKSSWNKFREISREINREKNEFYKKQKAEQKNNIALKKALIEEVKAILENDDWRSFSNRMKNIQKDWRAVGFVPRKLSNELWEEFRSQCNLFFDRIKTGYQKVNKNEVEAHQKKEDFIQKVSSLQIPTELKAFEAFFDQYWEQYNQLGTLTGATNTSSIRLLKKTFQTLIDQSEGDKDFKIQAKNYLNFSTIKKDGDGLAREIQKIKKLMDERNTEARQLENNLDYFSNASTENPLFAEVSSKLDRLKSAIEKHKAELVELKKLKRTLETENNTEEENPEQADPQEETREE
ncbi:MAG: DUF349 domain-containing protein [Flavobacteriia bacterium]|nr:DUF349 domain-containing protein [Flavobacteriia bacterium]